MKHILLTLTAALLLVACGSKNQYTLHVHLADEQVGTMVYLYDLATQQPLDSLMADSAMVTFSGDATTPKAVRVQAGNFYGICFLESGTIELDPISDALFGTPLNERYAEAINSDAVQQARGDFYLQLSVYQSSTPEEQRAMYATVDSLYQRFQAAEQEAYTSLYESNPNDVLGAFAFASMCERFESAAEMEKALEGASDLVRQYAPVKARLELLLKQDATAVGKTFVDFEGTDYATGEQTTLGKMIEGKLALVDVWASWCGPCRAEIRDNLVRIHKEYAAKGLYVVGVDVNDKPEGHKKAVEDLGVTYAQLIDPQGTCCDLYGINGIPHIMLIAPDGTILARDLRGDAIEEAVKEHLQ